MKSKRQLAIEELIALKIKFHLYTDDNQDLVEKRIKELVKKYKITYEDIRKEKNNGLER